MAISGRGAARVVAWATVGVLGLSSFVAIAEARQGMARESRPAAAAQPLTGSRVTRPMRPMRPWAAPGQRKDGANKQGARRGARGPVMGFAGRAVHGEGVVQTRDGFQTWAFQRGTASVVTPTSITVHSPDGFDQTYVVTSATKVRADGKQASMTAIHTGDRVVVVAVKNGATYTARFVATRPAAKRG
ncbi:MAG: hypothetical protein LC640_03490 [Frankia sp.]|nr:hypothetical protein [Frankia sp.]